MKLLSLLSASALILGSAVAASAQVQGFNFANITFDENGKGTSQLNNNPSTPLLFTVGTDNVLTYLLPFAVTPGDVLVYDNPVGTAAGAALPIGDILRFTANNTVQVYSDSGPNDPPDSLADAAPFPSVDSFSPNYVAIREIGPEGNNGAFYVPTAGQPGFNPGAAATTYGFISDAPPVPEASSVVSLGLLLMLGVGGFAVARKRKTA